MGARTSIEWTRGDDGRPGATWTPIRARYWEIQSDGSGKERIGWHCEHASEGCRHCYAEQINRRLGTGRDYAPAELYREAQKGYHNGAVEVFLDEKILVQPLLWGGARRIFLCSMTDLFGNWVPDEMLDRIFEVMGACEDQGLGHTFLILTKRAERQRDYMNSPLAYEAWNRRRLGTEAWPPRNIWAGVSVEDQRRADERIPLLLDTSAAVRWVSAEPLLGPVDLQMLHYDGITNIDALSGRHGVGIPHAPGHKLDWVVVGGESGPGARPFDVGWARSIIQQCKAAGTACFVKQLGARPHDGSRDDEDYWWLKLRDRKGGELAEWPDDLRVREYPAEGRA